MLKQNWNTKLTHKSLETVQLKDTQVKVIMPQMILNKIKYLCRAIPRVEWSGVLYYSVEGSIKDPENMVITLEDILPMHKGTAGYTEYTFDERVIEFMMADDARDDWKMGHIHSHNSMGVFFSGTDMSELEDNTPNHNYYLSLIVNNWMDFTAKVAFRATTDVEEDIELDKDFAYTAKDENGEIYSLGEKESYKIKIEKDEKMYTYDCDIETPNDNFSVNKEFAEATQHIIDKADKPGFQFNNTNNATTSRYPGGYYQNGVWHEDTNDDGENKWVWDRNKRCWTQKEAKPISGQGTFGFNNNSWLNREDTGTTDDEVDVDETEDFALTVLKLGNPVDHLEDADDILEDYKAMNYTGNQLGNSVLSAYDNIYDRYYDGKYEQNDEASFIQITENIIEYYEKNLLGNYVYLKPVIASLLEMLKKFKKTNT